MSPKTTPQRQPADPPKTFAEMVAGVPEDYRVDWLERAAIMEYCGGMSREKAERQTLGLFLRKHHPQQGLL